MSAEYHDGINHLVIEYGIPYGHCQFSASKHRGDWKGGFLEMVSRVRTVVDPRGLLYPDSYAADLPLSTTVDICQTAR